MSGCVQNTCFNQSFDGAMKSHFVTALVNSAPSNKIVDLSKFKAFADVKINMAAELNIVLGRAVNIGVKSWLSTLLLSSHVVSEMHI